MSVRDAVIQAIDFFGSEPKLAAAIGYSQHGVWRAKNLGRVSARMAVRIELATGGAVPREATCPEVFGPEARRNDGSWAPYRMAPA